MDRHDRARRTGLRIRTLGVGARLVVILAGSASLWAQESPASGGPATLDEAQRLFYIGQYEAAAATALAVRSTEPENLATFEVRMSALLFQMRRLMGEAEDKDRAFRECQSCGGLRTAFMDDFSRGRSVARAKVEQNAKDETALFFLGKLDLNYVWLQLGVLGHRTGWNEYWEARRSLDAVLKLNPSHVRARVARAWIDYIVDTRMTWGFRWLLGGGNKRKAVTVVREAAMGNEGTRYEKAEAGFGLWDMENRERNIPGAVAAARQLAREFPENQELARFLAQHGDP